MIDIIGALDKLEIDYKLSGKNVSRGWVEITCVFPNCNDSGYHLGINLSNGLYHCWVCGAKGKFISLLTKGFGRSFKEAKRILTEFSDDEIELPEKIQYEYEIKEILPKEATANLPELHRNYLISRRFDPDLMQKKYKILACYTVGHYAYRIIIPIIESSEIVNFTARDVTGKQEMRYVTCPNDQAVSPMKECVYNLDNLNNNSTVIICEGIFDAWRMGNGAVATMGTEFTPAQIALIARKRPKSAFVLFDKNAISQAEKIANHLSLVCKHIEILTIDAKDPAELTDNEALAIRKEIGI